MAKPTITCKLTEDVAPAVEAHIIPKAFYNLYDTEGQFRGGGTAVTLEGGNYRESKRRIGVYDQKIVTQKGEDHFKKCDDYAAKFFLQDFARKPWKPWPLNPDVLILDADQFDSDLIRRFCMTVLWRAHATNQPFFTNVDLGPHEARLRKLIREGKVGDPRDFSIILSAWKNLDHGSWPIMAPTRIKVRGLTYYLFQTSGTVFHIKVDSRSFPDKELASVVGGASELAVLQRDYSPSKAEVDLIKRIAKRNEAR